MLYLILFSLLGIVGAVFQFYSDQSEDANSKRKFGLFAIIASIALLLLTNIGERRESDESKLMISQVIADNTNLQGSLDSLSLYLGSVNLKQNQLIEQNDSLRMAVSLAQDMLMATTQSGFRQNVQAIADLNKVAIGNDRLIPFDRKSELIKKLSGGRGSEVAFGTVNTPEAVIFSGQLKEIFEEAGWIISEDERWLAPSADYVGIYLFANQNSEHKHGGLVYGAIKSTKLRFEAISRPEMADKLKIVVGYSEKPGT